MLQLEHRKKMSGNTGSGYDSDEIPYEGSRDDEIPYEGHDSEGILCDSDFSDLSEPGSPNRSLTRNKCLNADAGGCVTKRRRLALLLPSLLSGKSLNTGASDVEGATLQCVGDKTPRTPTDNRAAGCGLSLRASSSKTPSRSTSGSHSSFRAIKMPSHRKTVGGQSQSVTEKTPSRPINELSVPVSQQKELSSGVSGSDVIAALGEVTKTLHNLVDRLDRQESQLKSLEHKVSSSPSSSGECGKIKVPSTVRVSKS